MRKRLTPDRLLEAGVIHGPHGLKGALTIYSYTRPAIGIAGYSFWWLGTSAESARPYKVERCWQHGRRILAELEGVTDCSRAEPLRNVKIRVDAAEIEISRDEYLWRDLIGCEVRLAGDHSLLGTVSAMEEYGAQDILTVRTPADSASPGEWMLPFVSDVIVAVHLDARRIIVNLPEGMDACFTPGF